MQKMRWTALGLLMLVSLIYVLRWILLIMRFGIASIADVPTSRASGSAFPTLFEADRLQNWMVANPALVYLTIALVYIFILLLIAVDLTIDACRKNRPYIKLSREVVISIGTSLALVLFCSIQINSL